jgi:hypothetical protein
MRHKIRIRKSILMGKTSHTGSCHKDKILIQPHRLESQAKNIEHVTKAPATKATYTYTIHILYDVSLNSVRKSFYFI